MNIEALEAVGTSLRMPESGELQAQRIGGFGERLYAEFQTVNEKLVASEGALQKLATGEQENIHHVMLALEDARMSFQLLVQVRNKVLDAYQEVMRMQV